MKKLILLAVLILLLAGCGNSDNESSADENNNVNETEEVNMSANGDTESEASNSSDMKTTYRNKLAALEEQLAAEESELDEATQTELTEFAGKSFNMWDEALNEIYTELEKQLSEQEMESLQNEQQEWIGKRDAKAAEEAAKYEGGSMETMQYITTQAKLTKERSYELINNNYMD